VVILALHLADAPPLRRHRGAVANSQPEDAPGNDAAARACAGLPQGGMGDES